MRFLLPLFVLASLAFGAALPGNDDVASSTLGYDGDIDKWAPNHPHRKRPPIERDVDKWAPSHPLRQRPPTEVVDTAPDSDGDVDEWAPALPHHRHSNAQRDVAAPASPFDNTETGDTAITQAGALVTYYNDVWYNGRLYWLLSEDELNARPDANNAVCYYIEHDFMVSIKFEPRSDHRYYGCRIYENDGCAPGDNFWLDRNIPRGLGPIGWGKRAKSMKCWMP